MRVLILEDETLNAEIITEHLKKYDPTIEVVAYLKSKEKTKEWIVKNGQVDLVYSDIELLDGNVFSLLKENIITSPIIFTTAYNNYYQDAFDVNGIAYLLKPINFERFFQAMKKFNGLRTSERNQDWSVISELLEQKIKRYKERIIIKTSTEIQILNTEETAAILSHLGKLTAIDQSGKEHEFRYKLSDLAKELDPKVFFQINRGEIININFIEKIEPYFNDRLSIKMSNVKAKLITSTSSTAEFRKWIGQY
ncbi:response regulator transcription factor (plasmid) [Chryseobacterium sp. SNU WT5]|uniref:LytR/AlgR family response regulator transcription factor n=1 Tax=Chryseobacterium sp. SNU WT5 TaxID=2594269 RepID=UPI00117EB229|nr:LytTR family DNA-binding domain-containing protein [Chryseobacterium sp. SNU WT5]QDP86756.1 response regulator transcription factor [Chryseobacterium sp. SNU WT5]